MFSPEGVLLSIRENADWGQFRGIEEGSECIVVIDRQLNYIYSNHSANAFVGLEKDTLVGKSLQEGLSNLPHMLSAWQHRIEKVFQTGQTAQYEDRTPFADHTDYSKSTAFPIRARDGRIFAVGIVFHDLSLPSQRNNALRGAVRSSQTTTSGANNGSDAAGLVCRFREDGYILYANQAFHAFFQRTGHYPESRAISDFLPDLSLERINERLTSTESVDAVFETEFKVITAQGKRRALLCVFRRGGVEGAGGQAIILYAREVTQLREQERARREEAFFASIGRMSSLITHKLRTPLTSLQINVDLLRKDHLDLEAKARSLDILHREVYRLRTIVDDILGFSRFNELSCANFPIQCIVDDVCAVLTGLLDHSCISLECDIEPCTIYADMEKIRDVLENLIGNAVQAIGKGGSISIHGLCRSDAEQYVITVTDSGPGVTEPDKIFLPFYTTKKRGTGLGLPRGVQIAESHGGSLTLASSRPGQTTFALILPVWRT
ncbi:MAG: PAS domain-containing protein [Bacteroidetes bacterium]|nr:PAS domain-containing protein [Bacteroidota bacterium]